MSTEPEDAIAALVRLAGPRPAAPQAAMARVRLAVHGEWLESIARERRRRAWSRTMAPLAAAAAVAAAVAIVAGVRGRTAPGGVAVATVVRSSGSVAGLDGAPLAPSIARGDGVRTGMSGRAALRLAGGAVVRLDTGTRVRIADAVTVDLDRGSVYVDTAGPPAARVEIRTALGRVRDVGTLFEVRLDPAGLRVSVREGKAILAHAAEEREAAAGTRLRLDPSGAVQAETVPLDGPEWGWVLAIAPPFELEGRTLRDYLDWLARETGWRLEYADPSIAPGASAIVLHGSVSGLRPDETPAVVLPTCGLRHRLDGDTLVLERSAPSGRPS